MSQHQQQPSEVKTIHVGGGGAYHVEESTANDHEITKEHPNHQRDQVTTSDKNNKIANNNNESVKNSNNDGVDKITKPNLLLLMNQDMIKYDPETSWLMMKNRPVWLHIVFTFVLVVGGFGQGAAYHRIGLTNPVAITQQFTFRAWMVMRFFFSSMGMALFCQGIFDFFMPSLFDMSREVRRSKVGYVRSIVGGCVLGIGLAFCGNGAAITGAQVGAGSGNIGFCILGLFCGAFVSSLISKFVNIPMNHELEVADCKTCDLDNNNNNNNSTKHHLAEMPKDSDDNKKTQQDGDNKDNATSILNYATVDDWLSCRYWKLAIPAGIFIFGCACILEFAIPGTSRADDERRLTFHFWWPTIVGGVITGINNVLFPLVTNKNLSGARIFFYPISLLSWGYLAEGDFPRTWVHLGQVLMFWLGMPLGAFASLKTGIAQDEVTYGNLAVATAINTAPGLDSIWRSIVGGFLTTVAVFIAGDCNCGKSIGVSFSFENILMTGCLFGSAIGTGWVIYGAQHA